MTHYTDTYDYYGRDGERHISDIACDDRINPKIIKMYVGFHISPMKYLLDQMGGKPIICFGSCKGIDFTEYEFVNYIEEIYTDGSIKCTVTDFTCFISLLLFSLSFKPLKNISKLILPNSVRMMHISTNQSLVGMTFPTNLRKILFSCCYDYSLENVRFPESLQHIQLGTIKSCTDVTLPSSIEHISVRYEAIQKKLFIFPPSLRILTITTTAESLNDLPNGIEELCIYDVNQRVTNLPSSLQKITVKYMSDAKIIKKFKKLPYGCIVLNKHNEIILSS
ncbi:MAG: hypothetical protein Gaeavirus35_4 [Gaeavirus sp.]|uniref:Uncharacterized protein n=1 Tax=Gaeavirus sp. TaxID=2487767 RepID=A0A3G5A1G6_9VIRU|nr:MAG: hypothetical protein Gaeavirus35_4 [Gaeavirus sp.]